MATLEWIRFGIGTALLAAGLITFALELFAVYRFRYVLNRMQVAAMGDTLGIGISLVGLMVLSGLNFTTLKLGLVVVFLWCSSPVSSHLIARLEVATNPKLSEVCELPENLPEDAIARKEDGDVRLEEFVEIDQPSESREEI